MLTNLQNYGYYLELAKKGYQEVNINDVLTKETWYSHVKWITNIQLDGIDLQFVHQMKLKVNFQTPNNDYVYLSVYDYYVNIILWYIFLYVGERLTPYHIYFTKNFITRNNMKRYIDTKFTERYQSKLSVIEMSSLMDDVMCKFAVIDEFSFYLSNTLTLQDFSIMQDNDPEVYDAMHCDLSNVPIEDVKNVGMQYMNLVNDKIKESPYHCLRYAVGTGETISDKQEKEVCINIGSKPDGLGGAYPWIINKSFLTGGVNDLHSYYIDTSAGRIAQIINKTNVGKSGQFARLLSLNNRDTFLNPDPNYSCVSHNYEKVFIESEKFFQRLATGRYYKFNPDGDEHCLLSGDYEKVKNKWIYLRSPMTCASNSDGNGICYKCYGKLAYRNRNLNIGQLASELLSSVLTQKLLSAKHLFESKIIKIFWNEDFKKFFDFEGNTVKILNDINVKGYRILLDPDSISLDNDDIFSYPEITAFDVMAPNGRIYNIYNSTNNPFSILEPILELANQQEYEEDFDFGKRIAIPMEKLVDEILFATTILNDDLSKTLERMKSLINKEEETVKKHDRHTLLQDVIKTAIEGGLSITAVHLEVILSNQIRSKDNILDTPNWTIDNEDYQLITLNRALTDHPSVTVSMEYQNLSKLFYYPLTFKKTKPSSCDLFFAEQPQQYFNNQNLLKPDKDDEEKYPAQAFAFIEDDDK